MLCGWMRLLVGVLWVFGDRMSALEVERRIAKFAAKHTLSIISLVWNEPQVLHEIATTTSSLLIHHVTTHHSQQSSSYHGNHCPF